MYIITHFDKVYSDGMKWGHKKSKALVLLLQHDKILKTVVSINKMMYYLDTFR